MSAPRLSAPVGDPLDSKTRNVTADVQAVRVYLFQAAARLNQAEYNPGPGYANPLIPIFPGPADPTVLAIRAFQSRFFNNPDGRVDPGGRTWRELTDPQLGIPPGPFWPFQRLPDAGYHSGMRMFGASRSSGTRCHAGCDLYYPEGTPVHAVADGVIVRGPINFYRGTDQLNVFHQSLNLTLRYGEIQRGSCPWREGDHVFAGEPIASIGRMTGINNTMLHLEIYMGRQIPRSVGRNESVQGEIRSGTNAGTMAPYYRLRSLVDPTPYVDAWRNKFVRRIQSLSAVPTAD